MKVKETRNPVTPENPEATSGSSPEWESRVYRIANEEDRQAIFEQARNLSFGQSLTFYLSETPNTNSRDYMWLFSMLNTHEDYEAGERTYLSLRGQQGNYTDTLVITRYHR